MNIHVVLAVRTGGGHTILLGVHVIEMLEYIQPAKDVHMPVHSSTLHQSPTLQTTQMFAIVWGHQRLSIHTAQSYYKCGLKVYLMQNRRRALTTNTELKRADTKEFMFSDSLWLK